MRPDLTSRRSMQIAYELVSLRCAAYRIIENKGRLDTISLEDPLHLCLAFDRFYTDRLAGYVRLPVKLSLGIDDDDHQGLLFRRPADHSPCLGIEHALAVGAVLNVPVGRRLTCDDAISCPHESLFVPFSPVTSC